jgi:hypothetical protein
VKRALLLLGLASCVPDLDVDESVLGAPRILAVRATPAEAAPGERVTLEVLYADATGRLPADGVEWSVCTARRSLAELGGVSRDCLAWEGEDILPLGFGGTVETSLPRDACRLFGPEPPPAEPGEPAGRVAEPDPSGGYAIPVRAVEPDDDAMVFGAVRLRCGLAGATQAVSADFRRRYRINEAPEIDEIVATFDDGRREAIGESLVVRAGERVVLEARWPACPDSDVCGDGVCGVDDEATCAEDCTPFRGCRGAERYLRFDPESGALVTEREAMRVRFVATAGRFETERAGREPADPERGAASVWNAPTEPGPGTLFVVVRDGRGATSFRSLSFRAEP